MGVGLLVHRRRKPGHLLLSTTYRTYHFYTVCGRAVDTQSRYLIGLDVLADLHQRPPVHRDDRTQNKECGMADDTSKRLEAVQTELAEVLEERLGVLAEALAHSERTTRRIIASEVELERNTQSRHALTQEVGELEQQVRASRSRCDEARRRHEQLAQERDSLQAKQAELDRGLEQSRTEVSAARERVEGLEQEATGLRSENTALRTKLKTLEENLTRMRQLKDELMSSISGLTQQMSGVAGGKPD
jgi:chromosome segregation ATPase